MTNETKTQTEKVPMSKKDLVLSQVKEKLTSLVEKNIQAFPKDFNQTRFLQNCLTVLSETKNIESLNPVSVARTMIKGAYLGLDFFNGECYAIPYGNDLSFQTDYKGEIKLIKTYSINKIKDVFACLVRDDDELSFGIIDGKKSINFKPKLFNNGKIIGAFAVIVYDNDTVAYEAMSLEEMNDIKAKYSKCPNSPAWEKSPGEMYKKTVLKRLCKTVSLNFDSTVKERLYKEASGVEFDNNDKPKVKKVLDPFSEDQAIDVEVTPEETTPKKDMFDKNPSEVKCDENGKVIDEAV